LFLSACREHIARNSESKHAPIFDMRTALQV
jgi:hypothetical protein